MKLEVRFKNQGTRNKKQDSRHKEQDSDQHFNSCADAALGNCVAHWF
jgi:hypothetical protein